jgi:hypothetical protein
MKKTKTMTAFIAGLALTVLAGEALAGPAGPGPGWGGSQGRGYGPGWGRMMAGGPQMNADPNSAKPDNSWRPGPFCPFAQDPNQNIQGWQGRGPGGYGPGWQGRGPGRFRQGWQGRGPGAFGQGWQGRGPGGYGPGFQGPRGPYCPFGQGPNQNFPGWQGRRPGRFGQGFLQGRGLGANGWGFGRRNMMMQPGPMAGRGFQRRGIAPQGWGMNNWQGQPGPRGADGQGPGMQPRRFAPGNMSRPMPPRGRG